MFKRKKETKDIPFNPKRHTKLKLFLSSIVGLVIMLFISACIYGVYSFFHTYGLQSPVVLRSPIYQKQHEVIVSPTKAGKDKSSAVFNVGDIADKIYTLESSNGKNDGCRKLGLYNGYGFAQNSSTWNCYGSHEEVRQLVITWLTNHIKDGDVETALCLYNRGISEKGCTYAVNFAGL